MAIQRGVGGGDEQQPGPRAEVLGPSAVAAGDDYNPAGRPDRPPLEAVDYCPSDALHLSSAEAGADGAEVTVVIKIHTIIGTRIRRTYKVTAYADTYSLDALLPTDDRFGGKAARGRWLAARSGPKPRRLVAGARSTTPVDQMSDGQFERYALEVLQRELGPDGLARLLRLNRPGKGDYTQDRIEWQRDLRVAGIVASLTRPNSQ